MRHRDARGPEGVPAGSTRGSPYKSTTKRGEAGEAGRMPADTQRLPTVAAPVGGEVAGGGQPLQRTAPGIQGAIAHQAPAAGRLEQGGHTSSGPAAGEGIPAPMRPKVVFGGTVKSGGPSAAVVVLILASIAVLGVAAILLGRAVFSPGRSVEEAGSPEGETAGPPTPESTDSKEPKNRRIGYGKFEVVVPTGWVIVSQSPNALVLQDPTGGAHMEIRAGYSGSHAGLRPQCRTPAPSPQAGTDIPTPIPSGPRYDVFSTSTVPVGTTTGEMEQGEITCPEGELVEFATVVVRAYSIGISYRGDPADLRFMLPDLIVEV